jgi:hypothetical protein
MWIWIKNTAFSMQIRGFAICRLDTKEICGLIITNLRICDLRTCNPKKFADLTIAERAQEFADLRFADQ